MAAPHLLQRALGPFFLVVTGPTFLGPGAAANSTLASGYDHSLGEAAVSCSKPFLSRPRPGQPSLINNRVGLSARLRFATFVRPSPTHSSPAAV